MIIRLHATVIFLSGLFVLFVSSMVIAGYYFDRPEWRNWNQVTEMALTTALCFFDVGINMLLISMYIWQKNRDN